MSRVRIAIPIGLVAALALAACAAPRAVFMPRPPSEIRREAGAPAANVAGERAAPAVPPETAPPAIASPAGGVPAKPPAAGEAATLPAAPTTQAAVARPALPDRLPQYTEACGRTQGAIAQGAAQDLIPLWRNLEDSKWGTDAIYNQGVLFQIAGNLEQAARQYRRALERSPAFEHPLANLIGISLLRGDREEMKSLLARALPAGSPLPPAKLPELAVNEAAALMETGRQDNAALLLFSLRDRGQASPALPWNLAVLSFRNGDLPTARDLSGKVPSDVASLFPVVASRFAWAQEGEKVPALGAAPRDMAGMAALSANLAAFAAFRAGSAAVAEKILAPASAGQSVRAEFLTNIGIMQAEQGRWAEARMNLERAVRENPGLPAAWLNLGIFREIYEGNLSGARQCYDNYGKIKGLRKEEVRIWSDRLGASASPPQ